MGRLSPVHISNNVEVTFDFVERIAQLVAFYNVAWTLLLVWMGLYSEVRFMAFLSLLLLLLMMIMMMMMMMMLCR